MTDYFQRIERQLTERIEAGARPARLPCTARVQGAARLQRTDRPRAARPVTRLLAPALGVLVVVAVAAVFLTAHRATRPLAAAHAGPGQVSFTATPLLSGQPLDRAIARSLPILRARLRIISPLVRVSASGTTVTVTLPGHRVTRSLRTRIAALTANGQVEFYDWEGSVLTPSASGAPAASGLPRGDRAATLLSQGGGSGPGSPDAGSLSTLQALRLAARQPATGLERPHYYAISAYCDAHLTSPLGTECVLYGPAPNPTALRRSATSASGRLASAVKVPPGVRLVRAISPDPGRPPLAPGLFVLRGTAALTGSDLTDPGTSTDQSTGTPRVSFRLTAAGARRFHRLTAVLARRGSSLSGPDRTLDQHFAFVLDGTLISVPYIDFRADPDGISGSGGSEITGGFGQVAARDLAAVLRYGPLAVTLTPR